jgi:hypothetical protein
MNGGAGGEDGEDVNSLLNAIRTVAREDDAAIARLPSELSPALTDSTRAHIAAQILRAQAQERQEQQQQRPPHQKPEQSDPGRPDRREQPAPSPFRPQPTASFPGDTLEWRRQARSRSRRAFALSAGGLVVAAAAGLLLWMRPSGTDPDAPALPGYAVSATGGVADVRGAGSKTAPADGTTAARQRLRPESQLRVVCRPDTSVVGPVAVRAFFIQGGQITEVKPQIATAPTGAIELRVRGADLGGNRGQGDLRVVLGRPDAVLAFDPHADGTKKIDGPALRRLTVPLDLESP